MRIPKWIYCADCRGFRIHSIGKRLASGFRGRTLTCGGCEKKTRLGVCCPKCGGCQFDHVSTTHRGEATVRIKECRACHNRIRTRETIESFAS